MFVEHCQTQDAEDRGALPKEEGDLIRECKAMHEEDFLSSWLREDVEGRAEEMEKVNREEGV